MLAAVALAVAVGFGVVAPAIPQFAREFGVGRTAAGAVVSAFAFARLVFALAGGQLVDRLGERRVLAVGIAIVAVSSALAGLSTSYVQLLVLRGIGGVGSAMFTVSAFSLLLRVAPAELRGRATGVFQAGFLLGGILGPAVGGLVTAESVRAPFFLYAGTLGVAGAIAIGQLSRARLAERTGDDGQVQRTTLREALGSSAYRAALVTNFGTGWTLFGVRNSLLPLFVLEALRRDARWTGIGLVLSALAQAALLLPAGWLADTRGRRPAMVSGAVLAVVATALLAVSETLGAYLVSMVLFGAAYALLSPAATAVVGDVVTGRGGTVVAAFGMAADVGSVLGPLLAGYLADTVSYSAAWASCSAVMLLGVAMSVVMSETRRPAT